MRAYPELLRRQPAFARLWLAQVVSLLGDWFTMVALSVLVAARSGGSGAAVSVSVIMAILPYALFGPWSGSLVDRFDRRRLMIASDLVRAALLVGLAFSATGSSLGWIYLLTFLHFTVATVFEPARTALVPELVAEADLVTASTLSSATWSAMAAAGALVAGTLVGLIGQSGALLVDAATFLLSALLIASIRPAPGARTRRERHHGAGLGPALRWLGAHPAALAALLVKTMNGLAVFDTFLILYGTKIFPAGEDGALSTGLLFTAIGFGAVTGPLALNRFNDGSTGRMRRFIALSAWCIALGLLVLALAPTLAVAVVGAFLRSFGGSGNWTFSTILLQKAVPEEFRGRVFALDLMAAMLVASASSLVAGLAIERVGVRAVVLVVSGLATLPAATWLLCLRRLDRAELAAQPATAGGLQ